MNRERLVVCEAGATANIVLNLYLGAPISKGEVWFNDKNRGIESGVVSC